MKVKKENGMKKLLRSFWFQLAVFAVAIAAIVVGLVYSARLAGAASTQVEIPPATLVGVEVIPANTPCLIRAIDFTTSPKSVARFYAASYPEGSQPTVVHGGLHPLDAWCVSTSSADWWSVAHGAAEMAADGVGFGWDSRLQIECSAHPGGMISDPQFFAVTSSAREPQATQYANACWPRATIGDWVWNDVNDDGVQNPGETGIAGVTVQLKLDGAVIATDTTANGLYLFTNVPAGPWLNSRYTVDTGNAPQGCHWTTPNSAGHSVLGPIPSLPYGTTDLTWDAGLHCPAATVTPTPVPSATPTPTASPTATPTATPTEPCACPTVTPTATPTRTPTPQCWNGVCLCYLVVVLNQETPTPTATSTPTASPTPTHTATPSPTPTPRCAGANLDVSYGANAPSWPFEVGTAPTVRQLFDGTRGVLPWGMLVTARASGGQNLKATVWEMDSPTPNYHDLSGVRTAWEIKGIWPVPDPIDWGAQPLVVGAGSPQYMVSLGFEEGGDACTAAFLVKWDP